MSCSRAILPAPLLCREFVPGLVGVRCIIWVWPNPNPTLTQTQLRQHVGLGFFTRENSHSRCAPPPRCLLPRPIQRRGFRGVEHAAPNGRCGQEPQATGLGYGRRLLVVGSVWRWRPPAAVPPRAEAWCSVVPLAGWSWGARDLQRHATRVYACLRREAAAEAVERRRFPPRATFKPPLLEYGQL